MKSDPPPNSTATFDSLWESLDEEAFGDLPPALAPKPVPLPERDTVLPPMPPPEYVQTMMELGEIDDPSDGLASAPIPPPPLPPGNSLGLVMATESELLLNEQAPADEFFTMGETSNPPAQPEVSKPPAFDGGFAARVAARRPPPAPIAPNTSSAGLRAVLGPRKAPSPASRPTNPSLPIPRAPSIPPPVESDSLDAFSALDSLGDLPFSPVITPPPPAPPPAPPAPSRKTGTPMDMRALRQDEPPASSRRSPKSGGFRLGKKAPTNPGYADLDQHDRVTPVSDDGALGWSASALVTGTSSPRMPAVAFVEPEEAPVSAPPTSALERASEMQALFEARNYSSALVLAESILVSAPNHAQARRCAESCREMLAQKYLDRLGGRGGLPQVIVSPEEMRWLSLDHRAGFLVSSIDGGSTIDELLDVCSMPELDALRILFELKEQGVIEVREPLRRKR